MGLISILFHKDPLKYERRGDTFFGNSNWGAAKLEYEKAIDAVQNIQEGDDSLVTRLRNKLNQAKESLSVEHLTNGQILMDQAYYDEAVELFRLAKELSQNREVISKLEDLLSRLKHRSVQTVVMDLSEPESDQEIPEQDHEEEYFMALCGTLPKDIQNEYISYGEPFRSGYLSLNRGDFGTAADLLSKAMDKDCSDTSYIPLELASAYVNLGRLDEARYLLITFTQNHPTALPGYQLLCEVYWEQGAFEDAEALLDRCPDELRNSSAYYLLRGENMFQSGRYRETIPFYQKVLQEYGWNEAIARALARSFEKTGEMENALDMYGNIINQCSACQTRVDPFIRSKFADISFDLGNHSSQILEIYLALAGDDPENAALYYEKVSRIYSSRGNDEEAHRFQLISKKLQSEKGC